MIAMKVAPSTRALACGRSSRGRWSVCHRAEQRRERAEGKQRHEQDRHALEQEADDGNHRGAKFGQLDPLGQVGLVEPVRQLATEPGEEEEGQHEKGAGERHERIGTMRRGAVYRRPCRAPENEKQQGVLQKIVIEGCEKLAPEERREPPFGQKRTDHR
jgi:hypothetical protein